MAYVRKSGKKHCVFQGNTCKKLACFSSASAAHTHTEKLHKKHNPKKKNRGAPARAQCGV